MRNSRARSRFASLAAPLLLLAMLAAPDSGRAQESGSYKLKEHVFNAGGHPDGGTLLVSPGFRVSLDALGGDVASAALSGGLFHLNGGWVAGYPPPGEVTSLRLADAASLVWSPEESVGAYEVYRGLVTDLSGGAYGACLLQGLPSTTGSDPGTPPLGQAFYYLVTARNLLGEEGTKGYASSGAERPNPAPCP